MSGESIRVGDWVRHPEFGEGLVLETKGAGDSASVVVSKAWRDTVTAASARTRPSSSRTAPAI